MLPRFHKSDKVWLKALVGYLGVSSGLCSPARQSKKLICTGDERLRHRVLLGIHVLPLCGQLWKLPSLAGSKMVGANALDRRDHGVCCSAFLCVSRYVLCFQSVGRVLLSTQHSYY
jgi:hypothetical protein